MMKIILAAALSTVLVGVAEPASAEPICSAGDSCDVVTRTEFDKVRPLWSKHRVEKVFDTAGYSEFQGTKYLTKFYRSDSDYVTISYVNDGTAWRLFSKTWNELVDD